MRVLVTGANGFVGSVLYNKLKEECSLDVVGTVRKNEDPYLSGVLSVGSIDARTDWTEALEGVSVVVHCAAHSHILKSDSEKTISNYNKVNNEGTLNLAVQALKAGVKRFIFLSSIGVNGNKSVRPFSFNDTPSPYDSYSRSKYNAELGLEKISKKSTLEVVVIRPPLVYGKRAPGNFGSLLKLINKKLPLPLGAIHNKRSFIGINNLVDFITICIKHPAASGQTFLVSDDEDVSTTELLHSLIIASGRTPCLIPLNVTFLRFLASILGKSSVIDKLAGDLQIDMKHVKDTLQWKPLLTFNEGICECFSDD
ncbi:MULTISPECIES: NAD-dependent epimerase/dehydratase family protein [unclassified Endozoicomonas]|uniref:NAD-dependent epimerase/dehydratase family protein n=1 Tax=unclassified Endozoicomonas TaxID=2644528 RepID=UPI0021473CD9|nr:MULTISPECIES: NAD-dependent epimerase/dehydratase family protein [unclassified Endozoicomonas]